MPKQVQEDRKIISLGSALLTAYFDNYEHVKVRRAIAEVMVDKFDFETVMFSLNGTLIEIKKSKPKLSKAIKSDIAWLKKNKK